MVLLATWVASAQAQLLPNLGGQRAGISALTFLKNDLSPRSQGMGGANVTLSGDGYSPVVNPAAASEVDEYTVTVSDLYYASSLHHGYVAGILPTREAGTFFGYGHMLQTPQQRVRTEFQPGGTGEFFVSYALAAGAGYSRRLSEQFSVGVSIKYLREQLASYHAGAVAADIGFLYRTDWRNLRFAAVLQHFGTNSTLKGTYSPNLFQNGQQGVATEGYPAPTLFKMGAQLDAYRDEQQALTVHAQLNHPNDNAENIRLGAEYSHGQMFFARAGIKLNVRNERAPTAGVGFRFNAGFTRIQADYGLSPSRLLGLYHNLGLSFSLGRPTAKERNALPSNQEPTQTAPPVNE